MRSVPDTHPIHGMFRSLTARSMTQVDLEEAELTRYLSSMLVRFVHIDGLYRIRDERGLPLHLVRDYTYDPFYQYMLRQFGVC